MPSDSSERREQNHASGGDHSPGHPGEDRLATADASGTYYAEFDPAQDDIVVTLVLALEAATGRDSMELPPLSNYADPDALNALFTSHGGHPVRDGAVHFAVYDHAVSIHSDGRILVSPHDETT